MLKKNSPAIPPELREEHLQLLESIVSMLGTDAVAERITSGLAPKHWLRRAFKDHAARAKRYELKRAFAAAKQREFRDKMRRPGRVLWKDRKKSARYKNINPDCFIGLIYKDRLGKGMVRSDLPFADPQLDGALTRWVAAGNKLTVDLPSKAEQNDRDIAAGKKGDHLVSALWWRRDGRNRRGATPRPARS